MPKFVGEIELSEQQGGYLVPGEFQETILVISYGLDATVLPSLPGPEVEAIDREIADRSWLWNWLYRNAWNNRLASFIVFRYPGVPSVYEVHSRCVRALQNRRSERRRALLKLVEGRIA